jgi:hypothetical protein
MVVSVHDVAPATAAASRAWIGELAALGVRATLLVVPGPWRGSCLEGDETMAAWLRAAAVDGHEIAQHGWAHAAAGPSPAWREVVNRAVCRGCGEFWSLDESEARTRLQRGRAVLWAHGLDPVGFTPPGWLASAASVRAMRSLGYRYTTSHRGVTDLVSGRRHAAFALSHRPGGAGERLGAELMRRAARRAVEQGRAVRLALHPADLARPGLREATVATISACLAEGATAVPYAEMVARLSASNVAPAAA